MPSFVIVCESPHLLDENCVKENCVPQPLTGQAAWPTGPAFSLTILRAGARRAQGEIMASKKSQKPKLKIKTKVKAGGGKDGVSLNHNERLR